MAPRTGDSTSPSLLRELGNPDNREAAWHIFLERYRPMIFAWCRRAGLGRDDAEEVSQTVLAKLVQEMRRFDYDPARRFRGWLKTLVHNAMCNYVRTSQRRPGDRASGDAGVQKRLEEIAAPRSVDDLARRLDVNLADDLKLAQQVTKRARQRVEPHTWQAFWQTAIDNEPAARVARRLGMTEAAVYVAKRRVGRILREAGNRARGPAPAAERGEP